MSRAREMIGKTMLEGMTTIRPIGRTIGHGDADIGSIVNLPRLLCPEQD